MKKKLILAFCLLLGLSWFMAVSDAVQNPKRAKEHLARASELETQGIYVDAITEYEKALEYMPGDTEVSLKMANAWLQTGNSRKFVSICKDVAEQEQNDSSALNCLMKYYVEKKDEASAVKYLKEFTKSYPENENAYSWFVRLQGSYEELYCNYEELSAIYNDSMVVGQPGEYGLADSQGKKILETEYQEVHPYSEDGLALVRKDDAYIYVDRDGQTRLAADSSYSNLGMLTSGRTVASVNGKFGLLDEQLQPVTEFAWDSLTQIANGVGAANSGGKWALINKNGKPKTEYLYEDVLMDENSFCSCQKRIFVKEQGKYHLVNEKGKSVGKLWFDDARCFAEDGYAAVCEDGKWGFVNKNGELILDFQYEDAQSFQHGFAGVCVDGKWGYIEEQGNLVVEPQFEKVTAFSKVGTAAVKDGKWMLIRLDLFQ